MTSLLDIRRRARRDLHQVMRVPAFFIEVGHQPVLVHVRVHTKPNVLSGWTGAAAGLASTDEVEPKILFMRDELANAGLELKRNITISIDLGLAYRIDRLLPPDDITVTAVASVLDLAETVNLPFPGPTDV